MSAILLLIEAANAEAARLRHMAQTTKRQDVKRLHERGAGEWEMLATAAKAELATIRPPGFTTT